LEEGADGEAEDAGADYEDGGVVAVGLGACYGGGGVGGGGIHAGGACRVERELGVGGFEKAHSSRMGRAGKLDFCLAVRDDD